MNIVNKNHIPYTVNALYNYEIIYFVNNALSSMFMCLNVYKTQISLN